MTLESEFGAMVEACLKAHEAVAQAGTPEMRALTRILLFQIGHEITDRQNKTGAVLNDN